MRLLRQPLVARYLLPLAVVLGFAAATVAHAAKPSLDAFFKAIAAENYAEAKQQADALLPQAQDADRLQISLAYGRVLLGLNQKEPARQYLATMAKQNLDGENARLMQVYAAWLNALDGKQDAAIKTLGGMLDKNTTGATSAEAADVLAMLYLLRGEKADAQRAVDFGLGFLKYHELKTPYIETLLRGRMRSKANAPDAEKQYIAAERLRQQGKFAEAGRAFTQLRQQFPESVWSSAAGFRIGQCFQGLNRMPEAIDHWQKFVAESPAGAWRGQARVALIDASLAKLDLAAASEQSLAATATLGKLGRGLAHFAMPGEQNVPVPLAAASDVAKPSWQEAAQDIHLRQGIVSLVDGRTDASLLALQQAKDLLSKSPAAKTPDGKRLLAGLDRLLAVAAVPLLPQSLGARSVSKDETTANTSGAPPISTHAKASASIDLCLKLGHIDNLLGRYDAALDSFTLAGTISRSISSAQRSFESLGLARALAGRSMTAAATKSASRVSRKALAAGEPDAWLATAKSLYQRSLKEYSTASWHDETLHELASLIERTAAQRFSPLTTPSAIDPGKVPPSKPVAAPTDAQRTERAKSLAAARSEALPYWLDLAKRFPKSRYAAQAFHEVGVLATEANQPDEAIAAFTDLVKNHPDSPWTPDAQVRLIDVKLEQQFDLPGAAALAASAVAWCEQNPIGPNSPPLRASASPVRQ